MLGLVSVKKVMLMIFTNALFGSCNPPQERSDQEQGTVGDQRWQQAILQYITHHPSPIIHPPSSITHHPSTIIHHPSSIIHHPSSIIHHPSSIIHQWEGTTTLFESFQPPKAFNATWWCAVIHGTTFWRLFPPETSPDDLEVEG